MKFINAKVKNFKSIDDSDSVAIDPKVTIIVGQNESGKTAFLQALNKANSIESGVSYSYVEEYPRKGLNDYETVHALNPAIVAELTYELEEEEAKRINEDLEFNLINELKFTVGYNYKGGKTISLNIDEKKYIDHIIQKSPLTTEVIEITKKTGSIFELIEKLNQQELKTDEVTFRDGLKAKFGERVKTWNALDYYLWRKHLEPIVPQFFYFDDYKLLPGKINLNELKSQYDASQSNPQAITDANKAVMSLLNIAGVDLASLMNPIGYEMVKARLESIAIKITDKVFEYWKQNQDLDVEFDIRPDPQDKPPYNSGSNLYIRIRNRRHRVSVPFDQRSKGFIWFFSFIIWFDCISKQLKTSKDLILLLDEPGLSLHALAQDDFLKYIEDLAGKHQILYTTHSPFMVPGDMLQRVRMVEDKPRVGTKITSNVMSSDPKTLFPLQAALGYTIAQNLFISKNNLLVEGPADLIYLRFFSTVLEGEGREFLRNDITVVPVGGLDKLATFIALLGANQLKMLVLHDYDKKPDDRLENLVREKVIKGRNVLNYAMFRDPKKPKVSKKETAASLLSSDVEDMISPSLYLQLFNSAYNKELGDKGINEADLPAGDRMVERISRYLKDNDIKLRESGGYNHYLIANWIVSNPVPLDHIDTDTFSRFEKLFEVVNSLLPEEDIDENEG